MVVFGYSFDWDATTTTTKHKSDLTAKRCSFLGVYVKIMHILFFEGAPIKCITNWPISAKAVIGGHTGNVLLAATLLLFNIIAIIN